MMTVTANPLAYRQAGLHMIDACVLALLVRAGVSGLTLAALTDAIHGNDNTIYQSCRRLMNMGLVEHPQRQGKQGRPNLFCASPAGVAVQEAALQVLTFPVLRHVPMEFNEAEAV